MRITGVIVAALLLGSPAKSASYSTDEFQSSSKTLLDYLNDGYEVKTVLMGGGGYVQYVALQKGKKLAICGYDHAPFTKATCIETRN